MGFHEPSFRRVMSGPELRRQRIAAGVGVVELSAALGISSQAISRLEHSDGWPKPPTVRRYLAGLQQARLR